MDELAQPSGRALPLTSTGVVPSVPVGPLSPQVTNKLAATSIPGWALKPTARIFEKVGRRDGASPSLLSRLTNRNGGSFTQK